MLFVCFSVVYCGSSFLLDSCRDDATILPSATALCSLIDRFRCGHFCSRAKYTLSSVARLRTGFPVCGFLVVPTGAPAPLGTPSGSPSWAVRGIVILPQVISRIPFGIPVGTAHTPLSTSCARRDGVVYTGIVLNIVGDEYERARVGPEVAALNSSRSTSARCGIRSPCIRWVGLRREWAEQPAAAEACGQQRGLRRHAHLPGEHERWITEPYTSDRTYYDIPAQCGVAGGPLVAA